MLTTICNTTVLILLMLAALAVLKILFPTWAKSVLPPAFASSLFSAPALIAMVVCGGVINSASRIYLGYIAPADFGQDIIAGQRLLKRQSLYPADFSTEFADLLKNTPPPVPFASWAPALRSFQARQLHYFPTLYVVQAHPPLVAAIIAPLIALFGPYGSFLAVSAISIAAILAAAYIVKWALRISLSPKLTTLAIFGLLGWAPMIATLRHGQTNCLVSFLIILSWFLIRSGQPVLAGIAVGAAVNLKIYPALLLLYFLFRQRRALISGVVTAAAIPAIIGTSIGFSNISGFLETTKRIAAEYGVSSTNFSLIGRMTALFGNGTASGTAAKVVCMAIIVVGCLDVLRRNPSNAVLARRDTGDIAFAMLVCGSLLLTPLCGSHYFVVLLLPIILVFIHGVDLLNGAHVLVFSVALLSISMPDPPITVIQHLLSKLAGNNLGELLGSLPTWAMLTMFLWLWLLGRRVTEGKLLIGATDPVPHA